MRQSLVLLPTYEERSNIERLLRSLGELGAADVLVIDDSSPDGTAAVVEAMCNRYSGLSLMVRERKEGLGPAYAAGFREALRQGYERIVTMDADHSHAPRDVPRLLAALDAADVAIGSRYVRGGATSGWPLRRRLLSRAGGTYARLLLGLRARDPTSGFRSYRRSVLERLDWEAGLRSSGFVVQVELLRRLLDVPGTRVVEVPIVFRDRARGESKLSGAVISEAALAVARLALRSRPRRAREPQPAPRVPRGARQQTDHATFHCLGKGDSHA